MKHSRIVIRPALFLVMLAVFALLMGCTKQETTAPKTETATQGAQGAPQGAPPAAEQPAPAAAPPAEAGKTTAPSKQAAGRKPTAAPPSAPAAAPAEQRAAAQPLTPQAPPPPPPPPAPVKITIPAETAIEVRLQEAISSEQSKDGQRFTAVLASPLVIDGETVARKGANAWGTVVKATPSGRLQTPAELVVRLDAVEIHGKRVAISTATIGDKSDSHQKRNVGMIGGGAALGAAIGAIAGGGKGAAIGAAAGAGAGTAGAAATGKKDIVYAAETPLTFRLSRSVVVE